MSEANEVDGRDLHCRISWLVKAVRSDKKVRASFQGDREPSTSLTAFGQWLPPVESMRRLRLVPGRNEYPFLGEQSLCFLETESNLPFCHFDRSAAEWRNLAGNWADLSVRNQIPPLHPDFIGIPVGMTMTVVARFASL